NSLEIVPENWTNELLATQDFVFEIQRLVKAFAEPANDWLSIRARILASSGCYEKVMRKLKKQN
ncbi:unnamed protein product, partial [Larinioides sclopetarius]